MTLRSRASASVGPPPWTHPAAAWFATRFLILVAAVPISLAFGPPLFGVDPMVPRGLSVIGGWDTSWYLDIARHGYERYTDLVGVVFSNLPFFPLLPALMRWAMALHINPFVFALVLSNVAFLGALIGLCRLTRVRYGHQRARLVAWSVAAYPFTVYASMAYTDAITVFLSIAAALLMWSGRWVPAAGVAGVAALARPTGILVALLVALLAAYEPGPRAHRLTRAVLSFVPALCLLAGYLWWMQLTRGDWALPFEAQAAWGRGSPGIGLVTTLPSEIASSVEGLVTLDLVKWWHPVIRDGVPTAFYVCLLFRLKRMEGSWSSPWVLYSAAVLALPLSSGSFTSMTRFGLLAFPLAWAGADWIAEGGEPRLRRTLRVSAALMVLVVAEMLIDAP